MNMYYIYLHDTYLTERVAYVVDRLPLELESVHLEHLVARPQLAAPLGRASFHHATDDHALSLIPDRRTLHWLELDELWRLCLMSLIIS